MHFQANKRAMKDDYIIYSKNKDLTTLVGKEEIFIVGLDPAMCNFAVGIESRPWGGQGACISLFKFKVRSKVEDNVQQFCSDFINVLDEYAEWWEHINLIILERQMTENPDASRISQHALTYFLLKCPEAIIVEINPKLKGKILKAPKGLNYGALKKWSVEKGKEILQTRGDTFGLKQLTGKKLDDKCDVICEVEAFMQYLVSLIK